MSSADCVFLNLYWRNKFYIGSFFSIASCFFSDLFFINTSFLLSVDTFCYFSNFLKWSFYLLIFAFLSLFYVCFKAVAFPVSSILAVCLRFGHVVILLLLWSHYFLISLWCCLIHFLLRIMEKMFCLGGLQSYLLLMISNLIAKWVERLVCWFPIFNICWSMHSESEHGPFFCCSLTAGGEGVTSKWQVWHCIHTHCHVCVFSCILLLHYFVTVMCEL